MSNTHKKLAALLLLFILSSPALHATQFSNGIDTSSWKLNASVFECRMEHDIPYYGKAVFRTRAGEPAQFFLNAETSRLKSGKASVVAKSPIYVEKPKKKDLGFVTVNTGLRPIKLRSKMTEQMLIELFEGKDLWITRRPWYEAVESTKLSISTVGFRGVYNAYLDCLAGLLPANFEQIRRTAVYYGSSKFEELPENQRQKLDHIIAYVKADPSVKEFYIDGHTDRVGTRADNLELSKMRAETVKQYLINKGIPQSQITHRWHGERYPVASNDTVAGRAKNRRVTIRLEKVEAQTQAKM